MDLTLDEQKLLADFRRLTPAGKDELLEHAVLLGRRGERTSAEPVPVSNQCRLEPSREVRPEAAKEPIFTE